MASELGRLIGQMLDMLKARRGQKMQAVMASLADTLGVEPDTIYKWRGGKHKPEDPTVLARLVEIGVAEAGLDRQWAERVLLLAEQPERFTILERLFPESTPQRVHHNLPRRPYMRLIGREAEILEITKRLVPESRHWLIPIEGVGGAGKSALALEVGWRFVENYDRITSGRRFDHIVWISAKREMLTTKGIESSQRAFTNLDDVYLAIADVLDAPAILRVPREEKPREVDKALRRAGQVLLILDNLETVDDPQVLAFLRELPQPAKAVATMRFHEDMPYPIRLRELDATAAKELIEQESLARGLNLSGDQTQRLLEYTKGLPLAIWWAVGIMSMEGSGLEATLRRLSDPQGELLQFIFGEAVSRLKVAHLETYQTLLALSFFDLDTGAALAPLAATTGLDLEVCQESLQRLLNANLVNRVGTGDRFTMLPLTRDYAAAETLIESVWVHEARNRWVEWYKGFATKAEEPDNYSELRTEVSNLLEVMGWLASLNRLSDVCWLFLFMQEFFFAEGHWEPLLHFAELITSWAESINDAKSLATVIGRTLSILRERGGLDECEAWLNHLDEIAPRTADDCLQATLWHERGRLLSRKGQHIEGAQLVSKALDVFERQGSVEEALHAINTLGNIHLRQRSFEDATFFYQKALQHLNDHEQAIHQAPRWRSIICGNMGIVAGRQGRYAEACSILYDIQQDLTQQTDFVELHTILALYEFRLGHEERAWAHRIQANRIIEQLGLRRPYYDIPEDVEWMRIHGELDEEDSPPGTAPN